MFTLQTFRGDIEKQGGTLKTFVPITSKNSTSGVNGKSGGCVRKGSPKSFRHLGGSPQRHMAKKEGSSSNLFKVAFNFFKLKECHENSQSENISTTEL
jgi:hypothetical protein